MENFLVSTSPDQSIGEIGQVKVSSAQEIKESVVTARRAFSTWSQLSIEERKVRLMKLHELFATHQQELAELESKEMGMPIEESKLDLSSGLDYFRWYGDNANTAIAPEVSFESDTELHTVYYEPIGVAAVIMPWNFPFNNFIWGVMQNLIVGNTVVFKSSEEVPVVCKEYQKYVEMVPELSGVLNFVYGAGDVGDTLVHESVDLICFTGSTKTGQYLYKVAAEKLIKVVLELGGSAPAVVFADADVDLVVDQIILNRFGNCGQICDGLKRLIVHESIAPQLIEKLKEKVEALRIGNPIDEETNMGPLVAERQVVLLEKQVQDAIEKGAVVVTGGKRPEQLQGAFYLPTILTNVDRKMLVWSQETFGPVLPVITFKDFDEAIMLANDTEYGLGGYVFSNDKNVALKAARAIVTGMVSINGGYYVVPSSPFGGCKKSGVGREHGKWGLRELTDPKVIAVPK